jgi:heterodisulfide reductase subunit C
MLAPDLHPEQGPNWEWVHENREELINRLGGNYRGNGPGILRKIPEETLDELRKIFDVTGGLRRYEKIELYSRLKAEELNLEIDDTLDNEYFRNIYKSNNGSHTRQ